MSIKKYYPNFYDGIQEFEELANAEDILLKEVEDEIIQSNMNNFVVTADEDTIKALEHVLKIYDGSKYSLDFRRERIINRKSTKVPFTKITLMQQLDIIMGKGSYELDIDYNKHLLRIGVNLKSYKHYVEAIKTINKMKPVSLDYEIIAINYKGVNFYTSKSMVKKKYYKANEIKVSATQKNVVKILSGDAICGEVVL